MRVCRVLTLVICAALGACSNSSTTPAATGKTANAAPAPIPYTAKDHELDIESFEVVWSTIRDKHWDPTLGGLDWQAVHYELLPKVQEATSRAAARAVMIKMVHRLGQSHFNIIPAAAYESEQIGADTESPAVTNDTAKPPSDSGSGLSEGDAAPKKTHRKKPGGEGATGIDLRILDGRAIVTRITPGSPADTAGVKTGWFLSAVDGRSADASIDRIAKAYADSTMKDYYVAAYMLAELSGAIGDTLNVEFIDGQDSPVTKNLTLGPLEGTPAHFGNLPTIYVTIDSRRLPQNIHYFRYSMFFDPPKLTQQLAEAIKSAADADGFIIDLRGNPGGIGALASSVAGWFVDQQNIKLGTMYTRGGSLNFTVNPRLNGYRGPLAVLIDGMSASTSEVFAGGMQDIHRARIFGSRSAGAALPSVFEILPNNDRFQYAIANYISASGQTLEASGVTPDEIVNLDRATLLQGKDAPFEAAIAWILSQKTDPKPLSGASK